jgi:hypothetical protein
MADGNSHERPDGASRRPPTLYYRSPRDRPVSKGQIILGAIESMVLLMGSVFAGVLSMIGNGGNGMLIALVGCTVVGLNVWALICMRSINQKGLAMGIWIGFGVAVLLEGLCFGIGNLT